jgi:putative 4-mercaptohistidine N1-methyltranferase
VSYESAKLLAEYLLFHYGDDEEILPASADPRHVAMRGALGFPVRTVRRFSPGEVKRSLDLGCAVGRSTFEMSRSCLDTLGIDLSQSFISAAGSLRRGNVISYSRTDDGRVATPLTARLPDGIDPSRVRFETGDAMNLREDLGDFDRVHAANLLCRLPDPKRLLDRLPALVRPGGELVLATPCTWLEEFTPQENWPDGPTGEWLCRYLAPRFEMMSSSEEPFVIRETSRKFQWSSSLVTVWRRT